MRLINSVMLSLFLISTPLIAEDEEKVAPTINYYEIKPSLVANLASGGKYIRTDIQLMTKDESFMEKLALHDPAIRHTLLLLLSEQDGKTIKQPEGKDNLRKQALASVGDLMKDVSGKEGLDALYFTTFFIQ